MTVPARERIVAAMPDRPTRTPEHWESRYADGDTPWNTERVDRHLEAMVEGRPLQRCRVLDVGCGTGTDAVWLAGRGFTVTGVDFSETAIEHARKRAEQAGVTVDFAKGSFPDEPGGFGLAYDCGCFHTMPHADARNEFVDGVARVLEAEGLWLSILGSTDGPERDHGPPRVSAAELAAAVERRFELLSLTTSYYDANVPTPARAWVMLGRRRP